MLLTILLMLFFLMLLVVKNVKNKYSWIFIFIFLGLNVILFALLLYIIKLSNYRFIFSIENYVYNVLSKIRIGFYNVRSVINMGVGLFLMGMWFFINLVTPNEVVDKYKRIIRFIITSIPIILYLVINSFDINMFLYINAYKSGSNINNSIYNNILKNYYIINYIIIAVYIICPFFILKNQYISTKIKLKKVQTIVIAASLFLVDTFFIILFIIGPFRNVTINSKVLFDFTNLMPEYNEYIYTYMPVAVLIIFDFVCYILIKFKLLDGVDFMKKKVLLKNVNLLSSDVRHIFHSYKNALLSIEILQMKVEKDYGSKEGLIDLQEIKVVTEELMDSASRFLNVFNELKLNYNEINIIACVHDAIKGSILNKDVKIINNMWISEAFVYGDYQHIKEAFQNLFVNSCEAIRKSNKKNGEIIISAECESDWICITICDNGCGIEKKDLKNIFKPLYSTKKTYKNWGLGLSYVYQVVNAHLGFIFVESQVNKCTEFQVLLPNVKAVPEYE